MLENREVLLWPQLKKERLRNFGLYQLINYLLFKIYFVLNQNKYTSKHQDKEFRYSSMPMAGILTTKFFSYTGYEGMNISSD